LGSFYQFRIWKLRRINQFRESVPENVFVLPIVEAVLQFVQVGVEMLDTHLMIRTDDRTLQEAPDAFDAVSVNITYNPFILRVINPFMLCVGIVNSPIRWHFVRVNRFGVRRSVVMDKLVQGRLVSVRDNLQRNLS